MSLEAQRRNREALIVQDSVEAKQIFQEISAVSSKISNLLFSGPGETPPDVYRKKIQAFESARESLESRLINLSRALVLEKQEAEVDCDTIISSLPKNAVLLEFVATPTVLSFAKDEDKELQKGHYFAFILFPGMPDKVRWSYLGRAYGIDQKVASLRREIATMGKNAEKLSRELYDIVFAPIEKKLGETKEIFISPDGNLNLVPFEVLVDKNGRYLIEKYTFNYLSAARELVRFGKVEAKNETAVLIGDPDFDLTPDQKKPYLAKQGLTRTEASGISMRSPDMKSLHFSRLPGAKDELEEINRILKDHFQSESYTGLDALEETLKKKSRPKMLHLATHGFFMEDVEYDGAGDPYSNESLASKPELDRHILSRPMLRSGFVLAGANNAEKLHDENMEDGVVTAEEIQGLNLWGTDMVVLSACNTGLGEVQTGEGVFGLRRAFSMAGAKSLIMSMWNVPDKETKELMVAFYKNVMSGKMNRCQALRQAALAEMKVAEERYGSPYPFVWGAFVFIGDPGSY